MDRCIGLKKKRYIGLLTKKKVKKKYSTYELSFLSRFFSHGLIYEILPLISCKGYFILNLSPSFKL